MPCEGIYIYTYTGHIYIMILPSNGGYMCFLIRAPSKECFAQKMNVLYIRVLNEIFKCNVYIGSRRAIYNDIAPKPGLKNFRGQHAVHEGRRPEGTAAAQGNFCPRLRRLYCCI